MDTDTIYMIVINVVRYGVTPLISVLGIIGNVFSIIVLKREGLHKSSNILLISLAFTDICYLIGYNNIPRMIYKNDGNNLFLYSRETSYILFIFYKIFDFIDQSMGNMSVNIPMCITLERLIAVFLPLKFPSIVTPLRTWIMVILLALYCVPFWIWYLSWTKFAYIYDLKHNRNAGLITSTSEYYKAIAVYDIITELFLTMKVQPLFTLIGCVLIIIKVKVASMRRLKMTAGRSSQTKSDSFKTTRILLAVCLVYVFVCLLVSIPTYIQFTSFNNLMLNMIYCFSNLVMCANASWNFIIYVGLNPNFRRTFRQVISSCSCDINSNHVTRSGRSTAETFSSAIDNKSKPDQSGLN